jgi:hypothetical protein
LLQPDATGEEEGRGEQVVSRPRMPINHGTEGGYNAHLRQRVLPTCNVCRKAHAEYQAAWRTTPGICPDCGLPRRRNARGRCAPCQDRYVQGRVHEKKTK